MEKLMKFQMSKQILIFSFMFGMMACKTNSSQVSSSPEKTAKVFQCNTQGKSDKDPAGLAYGPSCTELTEKHPEVLDPNIREDKRVLCPFLRIIQRSQLLVDEVKANLQLEAFKGFQLPVSIQKIIGVTQEFGCSGTACGAVATQVSAGQSGKELAKVGPTDIVDIGNLSTAKGVAHECGFTFAYGDTAVCPKTRAATLKIFEARAKEGRLSFQDVMEVKKEMCKRDFALSKNGTLPTKNKISASGDTFDLTTADLTEVNLIYTYLGGVDNGYILYSDLDRFFHAEIPENKTKYLIDFPLFAHLKAILSAN
jgi:hypothetical protein